MIMYSATSRGFFDTDVHADIPPDAMPLVASDDSTPEALRGAEMRARVMHQELLAGQSAGKLITPDANGMPVLTDPAPLSDAEMLDNLRRHRDMRLAIADGLTMRHRDQVDAGGATTLTTEQFLALLTYKQALRDLPANTKDLAEPAWPASPV